MLEAPEIPGASGARIEGFNHQNVLSDATVNKVAEGYELSLNGIYGVSASIVGERISVKPERACPALLFG